MEPTQKEQFPTKPEQQDVDLGTVLYKTGQAINRTIKFIGEFFKAIFQTTLLGMVFLRNNIGWLVLGSLAGLGYGLYQSFSSGFRYTSVTTVKMNFGSTRALYNTADYLNGLRSRNKTNELSKIFNISAKEALAISNFEVAPVMNDLVAADMYKEMFMKNRRNDNIRQDTFWTRVMKFEDFKKQLTKYDYPVQEVTAICTDAEVFSKLQQGFVDLLSQNEMLKRNKELQTNTVKAEDTILQNSLKQLDTLSSSYNKRILRESTEKEGSVSNLTILDKTMPKAAELDLYNTKMALKDELTTLRMKNVDQQDIMQVYSPFSPIGKQQGVYSQSYFKSALNGLIVTFAILLALVLYRFLGKANINKLIRE
jgi:hypothetical protein